MKQNKRCPDCSSDKKSKRLEVLSIKENPKGHVERKLCQGAWHLNRKAVKA